MTTKQHPLLLLLFAALLLREYGISAFSATTHHYKEPILQQKPAVHHFRRPISSGRSSSIVLASSSSSSSSSIISQSNNWGNVAALSFTASLAQLMGKHTLIGKLLGAPVTAMALTFVLSSVSWIPSVFSSSSSSSVWKLNTLLPPGGSSASTFLQSISLTLATPLLLLGTSLRGNALKQCGSLLGSFLLASAGTLLGSIVAFAPCFGIQSALIASLPNSDGIKVAAALLAKNIGGGINYMAVCACLGASTESIAAGLCVDNVMALIYFPLVSVLASKYSDVQDDEDLENEYETNNDDEDDDDDCSAMGYNNKNPNNQRSDESSSPVEALSHAFTLAAVLTALGQLLNSNLHHLSALCSSTTSSSAVNLSLPITTLLTVVFSTYYPPNIFLSPTTTTSTSSSSDNDNSNDNRTNHIAKAGETLGTSLLYLFFATAGAPGWRLADSIKQSFPSIASFLIILYTVHGFVLWSTKKIVNTYCRDAATTTDTDTDTDDNTTTNNRTRTSYLKNIVSPQRLLVGSSAAIGGPATAAALAKSFKWESLLSPSLLVGNVGYAIATFIGLLFYGAYR